MRLAPLCCERVHAQETGSDRKGAKAVILDSLGPRRPWRGTLSFSDRLPCALSLFIADRFSVPVVYQQRRSRNGKHLPDVKRREHMPVAKHYGPPTKTPGAFLNDAKRWHGYERTSGMRCVLKTPGAFLNNAMRWPGDGRTSGMGCVVVRAERPWMA